MSTVTPFHRMRYRFVRELRPTGPFWYTEGYSSLLRVWRQVPGSDSRSYVVAYEAFGRIVHRFEPERQVIEVREVVPLALTPDTETGV